MNSHAWMALGFFVCGILFALIGIIYSALIKRLDKLEDRVDRGSPAVVLEKIVHVEKDIASLQRFRDEHLPKRLDEIASDCFGSIAQNKAELDRRIERLERDRQRRD